MSNRNNQQNKQAARERLRAERERQAKRDKTRRQLVVAGSIVVVLALAGGIGFAVSQMKDGDSSGKNADWAAAAKKDLVKPANSTGENGNEILIGDPKAKETLTVFEDPRCPSCAAFEQRSGDQLRQDVKDGRYKVRFVMVNFIDDLPMKGSGAGSKNAVSALGAALNVSPQAFVDYKEALYSAKNHPEETDDAYADDKRLIEVAQQVPALKGNKDFEKNVTGGTYDKWALEMGKLFGKDGVNGTPTLVHNGKQLKNAGGKNPPMAKEEFIAAIDKEFGPKK
ncbi:thioredoxin domain-containing protein [Streptomyces sp. ISL-11]|uniref:thioredoxin domain-containing protein n=1 Tax=Streptomyces sp. ISL-11 TaxID=2819174 RepID=UPI001BE7331D|nr:thioredoxin domain-containing protein [Streptomyces sp. ISL-11]MBT2385595.1 DsbA family protein [Streptomyces sp. ISL-11]